MTTPCDRPGCDLPADLDHDGLLLCARHYKAIPEWDAATAKTEVKHCGDQSKHLAHDHRTPAYTGEWEHCLGTDMTEAELNARYNVNLGNPAPGFLDRAERALDDMFGTDPEKFCPRCLAGTESSEHFERCGCAS